MSFLNDIEHIRHGTCEHLGDERCVKRIFKCVDAANHRETYIHVCNQYLHLRVRESQLYDWQRGYEKVIADIINDHIPFVGFGVLSSSSAEIDRLNHFYYRITNRPTIFAQCSIKQATEIFLERKYQPNLEFKECYFNSLRHLLDYMGKYKKYKTELKDARVLLNRIIKKEYNCEKEMSELFQLILTFKINKHATSKQ